MDKIEKLKISDVPGGSIISVKVVPGSSRQRISGVLGDCLKITTTAAPQRGKANSAVEKIIAQAVGLEAGSVSLVAGAASPRKDFFLAGLSAVQTRKRLATL